MPLMDQQIRRARARLNLNRLMEHATLGLAIAGGAWAAWVLIDRAFAIGAPAALTLGIAASVAMFITLIATFMTAANRLAAAMAIDRAAGLKERVSSALALMQSSDPFARATVADAERVAASVHLPSQLPLKAPRRWPLPATTLAVAALVWLFMPTLNLLAGEREKPTDTKAAQVEKQNIQLAINQTVSDLQERAKNSPGLEELAKELEPLSLPEKAGDTPEDVRRDVLKRLDNVTEKLEQRRSEDRLESLEQLKKELAKLETPKGDDAASKLAQALANGEMEAARKALAEMKKQMQEAGEKASPADQQQMAEMQKKLESLAAQLEKLADNTKLQKELENKAGLTPEQAKELAEKLANMDPDQLKKALEQALGDKGISAEELKELAKKIQQNQQARQACQNMAQAMAQAASAMQQAGQGQSGDAQEGAQAMDAAMAMMSELEMSEQMMGELEAQLAELKNLREGVCNGAMGPPRKKTDQIGRQGANEGLGYGAHIGEKPVAHQLEMSRVGAKSKGGEIIGKMLVDGPQVRGEATAEAREVVTAALRDATDAIERQQTPQQYHRVMRDYFESLAGLVRPSSAGQKETKP